MDSRHVLIVSLLMTIAGGFCASQATVGGEFAYRVSGALGGEEVALEHSARATATVFAGSGAGDLDLAASIEKDFVERSQRLDLERVVLTAYAGDYVLLRGGVFTYRSSVADFFPAVDFLKRTDFAEYFAGNVEDSAPALPLLQVTVLVGPGYSRLTVLPVTVEVPFFEPESIWFPNIGFPEAVDVTFPSPQTLRLSALNVDDYPGASGTLDEVSLQFEAGGVIGPVDLAIVYYHGQDMRPLYLATLEFPRGLFSDYEVRLSPVYRVVDALGGTAIAAIGPLRLYTEHAFRFTDLVSVERVSASAAGFQTELHESPTHSMVFGASYRLRSLLFSAEYTDLIIIDSVTRMIEPALEQGASLSVSWMDPNGRFSATAIGLMSLVDYSANTTLRLEAQSLDGSIFGAVTLPLFWGADGTELGQYSSVVYPTVSVGYRF